MLPVFPIRARLVRIGIVSVPPAALASLALAVSTGIIAVLVTIARVGII